MARLTTGPNYLLTIWKVSGILRRLKQGLRQMGIQREMLQFRRAMQRQGCRIKRWKLTRAQAKELTPNDYFYKQYLAGHGWHFGIPVTVIDA